VLFDRTFVAKIDSFGRAIYSGDYASKAPKRGDVRDIWRVERIAATVTSNGLLKSRRIDDLMDARSRTFQAFCLPEIIIS